MYPNEREYRVGPRGYRTRSEPKGDEPYVDVSYEPGALVWVRGVPPPSADLTPTGRERRYETKSAWPENGSVIESYFHMQVYPPKSKSEVFSEILGFDEIDAEGKK